ncbi:hypothetical protein [Tranquillimonas rosea]|uniref:hypothetical protein n=1 Tax=Tranquillimonas rosea TaxID=641238 RepID=UPI003BA97972
MAGFPKAERQRIIDGYLAATGRNLFNAAEFIDWLAGQPDHEAYDWFFGQDDATAAREYRIGLARRMASGLRIAAKEELAARNVVHVSTREYPAYMSPVAGRKHGGGYERFDPKDTGQLEELRAQGATALRSWLARYKAAMEDGGIDVSPIERIAAEIDGGVAGAA